MRNFKFYYLDQKHEYTYAAQFIREKYNVLEIGCGKGAFANVIKVDNFVGLEYNKRLCNHSRLNRMNILNESISTHSSKNAEKYDAVCAFQVLEHVPEVDSFIRSSVKCLKRGGVLIYSVPSADSFVATDKDNILNMPPHHLTWWSDRCLRNIAPMFGLLLIDMEHEELAVYHKRWFATRLVYESLLNIFRMENTFSHHSMSHWLLSKCASFGGLIIEGLTNDRFLPKGHSVTVVYRKDSL